MAKPKDNTKFNKSDTKSGRIGRLDEQTLGYYRRVSEQLKEKFEDSGDKELFIRNVFNQLTTEAVRVSQNQTASRIVEDLLHEASLDQLKALLEVFSKDWETVCTDRFASYVTQTLIVLSAQHYNKTDDVSQSMKALFGDLFQFLMTQQLGMHMQHTYSSHILRVVIEVLSGVRVSDSIIKSRTAKAFDKGKTTREAVQFPTPDVQFKIWLDELANKILSFPKLKEFAENYLSNPVLQTILLVKGINSNDFVRRLVQETKMFDITSDKMVPDLVAHEVASHLVEQVLSIASEELLSELYEKHLSQKLVALALHPKANFVLQTYIKSLKSKEQFEAAFSELFEYLEDMLAENHMGVIVALADAAIKHGAKQKSFIKAIQQAFHCYEPEERQIKLFPLLASLTTYDVFYKLPDSDGESDEDSDQDIQLPTLKSINYHGSVLLQKLFHFGNSKPVMSGLLQLKSAELQLLACDPCGSHVIDELVKSESVGEKSKEAFFNKYKGVYFELACHKNGSRTLDAMWKGAPLKMRITIAEELSKHESQLKGNRFGGFIWRNYALHHFLHRRHEWTDIQNGELKKRKMFEDIIGSETKGNSAKKPKKDHKEDLSSLTLQFSDEEDKNENLQDSSQKKKKQKTSMGNIKLNQDNSNNTESTISSTKKKNSKLTVKNKDKYGEGLIKDKSMKELLTELETKPKKKKKKEKRSM